MKVVSALVGTLVGITATVAIAWINQKTLHRRELIRDEMRMRQTLYGEFIAPSGGNAACCARRLKRSTQRRPNGDPSLTTWPARLRTLFT